MSKLLQLRGGTTSEHSSFTGAVREVTVDTTKDTLVVHDGSTAAGFALARESALTTTTALANAALAKSGGALTGALTTNSTIDGVDIATRDGILTSTTATAAAALAKSGGAMTGAITTNSTFDGRDVAADGVTADAALPKAGGTVTGLINMSDQILQRTVLKDYGETKVAMAAHAVDLELGNVFTYTLSGGQTVTFTNPPASGTAGSFTMIVTNGGSATLTWPTSVDWAAATAPTLSSAGVDVLTFTSIDGGTIWYGIAAGIGMG